MSKIVDLRSDTVTEPTPEMRQAIATAEVGDDVFGDDPTINLLESRMAELTGKEAAIYVVSGTMGNSLAIRSQTHHGDEIILDIESHIFKYESGSASALAGVQLHPLPSERGLMDAEEIKGCGRPMDVHNPPVTLVCLENTHNRAGGVVHSLKDLEAPAAAARAIGASVHLDGARLWNASAVTGDSIASFAGIADTLSLCFSKGLGAPVGSILCGSKDVIRRARRYRKMFGGGIRQGGILAAACLYALDHHCDRLVEDHARARRFAEAVSENPSIEIESGKVDSNIVLMRLLDPTDSSSAAVQRLAEAGVRVISFGPHMLRAIFHLGVDDEGLDRAIQAFHTTLAESPA